MNLTLTRNALKEAVAGIGKVVHGKSTLPVLGCVRLNADDGGLVAQATDLDQTIEYRFADTHIDKAGSCIVPLTTLKDLSKGRKGDQIEIHAETPEHVSVTNHVNGHPVRQSVAGMELDEWPHLDTAIETNPAPGFLETYRRLVPFSSTDPTRHVLNAVYVEVGKGEKPVTMVATDGRRLTSVNSMALPVAESAVVPVTKFLSWTRLPGEVEIGLRKDDTGMMWLGAKAGPFHYAVKTVDGTYPNFRQVVPSEAASNVVTFDDADVELLKNVLPTFPGDEVVTLVGDGGKVTFYACGPENEQPTTLTPENSTYAGERKYIGVNRQYLLDALSAGFREFSITDELSPVLSTDGKGGTHVLMPMRVSDPVSSETASGAEEHEEAPADKRQDASEPPSAPERKEPKQKTRKEKTVPKPDTQQNTDDTPALGRILVACQTARTKVKEAGQALTELSQAIKAVEREQKATEKEVEQARAAIKKVQSLKLAA